jgi:hypothetical protein
VPQAGVDCNVSPEPTSIHLEWEIARATGVTLSIDGPGIFDSYDGPSGSADVPFACGERRHTYLLTTTGGDGAAVSQEIVVRRARPHIREFSASYVGPNLQQCNYRFTWRLDYAEGVRIFILGNEYGSYNGREGDITVPYNCPSGDTVTYRLETTATYGPQDSAERQAAYP